MTLRSNGVKAAHEVSHEPHGETDEQGVAERYMIADARMIWGVSFTLARGCGLTAGSDDLLIISLSPILSENTIPPGKPLVPRRSMGSDHGELFFEVKESLLPYLEGDFPFPLAFLPIA